MNAGLQVGSDEWVRAIQSHYALDPDISALCECFVSEKKRVDALVRKVRGNETKINGLNVLLAHITELSQQMTRALQTMTDITKENIDADKT